MACASESVTVPLIAGDGTVLDTKVLPAARFDAGERAGVLFEAGARELHDAWIRLAPPEGRWRDAHDLV